MWFGKREGTQRTGHPVAAAGPRGVGAREWDQDDQVGLALEDGDEQRKEACDHRSRHEPAAAVHAEAGPHQDRDQSRDEDDVEGGHHVIRVAVIEKGERRDQQRVVRRVEVGQHDETRRILAGDLEFDLALHRDVVNGGAPVGDV